MIEIESLEDFDRAVERALAGSRSMSGWGVQNLDLTARAGALDELDARGALFLGCTIPDPVAERLRARGALLFPDLPDLPFDPWRATLYDPTELYRGLDGGYDHTVDARVYAWARHRPHGQDLARLLARALHDSSIDDALDEYTHGRRIVGVMGGHALTREEPAYVDAARLAHGLAAGGTTVVTGGGPGAMEAANLGARLADHDEDRLDEALAAVAGVPSYTPDITAWARVALDAVAGVEDSGRSLGIPTWHYGHEPPNAFASVVAKYFRNAIREDVLLEVSRHGIVFLPGAAGTVQEIFQAACSNYYAPADEVVPMVFVGEDYWRTALPAWPLVDVLAGGRPFADRVRLVGTAEEALGLLVEE